MMHTPETCRAQGCAADPNLSPFHTVAPRRWFRNSYGGITDGGGWEIHKDAASTLREEGNDGRPWSLWRRGEYVGNYPTVVAAKDAAHIEGGDSR